MNIINKAQNYAAPFLISLSGLEVRIAGRADRLALVLDNILGTAAEHTGALELLEDYHIAVGEDLHKIPFVKIEGPSELYRKNDTSEIVDFSDNSC